MKLLLLINHHKYLNFFKKSRWITSRIEHGSTPPYDKFAYKTILTNAIMFFSWIFPTRMLLLCSAPSNNLLDVLFQSCAIIFCSGVINDTIIVTLNYSGCTITFQSILMFLWVNKIIVYVLEKNLLQN